MSTFAYILHRRREQLKMTQRELGLKVGIPSKQISAYERGTRTPKRLHYDLLKKELGPLPWPYKFRTPKHNRAWRRLHRDQRPWKPHRDRDFSSRLKTARLGYAQRMAELQHIINLHRSWLEKSSQGSGLELVACLEIFDNPGAVELAVRPLFWGFRRFAICDQKTNENRSDYAFPAIGLPVEGGSLTFVPQVPIRIPDRVIVLDMLVAIRVGRRVIWVALEIDGPGHVSHADQLRALHFQAVRFNEREILADDFIDVLKRRLLAVVETFEDRAA